MKYRAVIFDLDGVVCSTDHYHYLAWKKIADLLGVYFDEKINHRLRGIGRRESLEVILEGYPGMLSEEDKLLWMARKNSLYRESLQQLSPADISSGFLPTLTQLQQRGIKTAIGSSSKNASLILSRLQLETVFDVVVDGCDISHSKPHPEVFLKASQYLNIEPEACLVVEDSRSGIEAARAANMDCAAIGDGTRYGMAQYSLASISDLLLIKELVGEADQFV